MHVSSKPRILVILTKWGNVTLPLVHFGHTGQGWAEGIQYEYHHSTKLYHEFVAVCIAECAAQLATMPTATNK